MGQGRGWATLPAAVIPELGHSVPELMNRDPCLDRAMVTEVLPSGSPASGQEGALERDALILANEYQAHDRAFHIWHLIDIPTQ